MLNNKLAKENKKWINALSWTERHSIFQWFDKNISGDRYIWSIAIGLSLFSILVVYSAIGSLAYKQFAGNTEYFLLKQFILVATTLFLIITVHKISIAHFYKYSKILWAVGVFLLICVQVSGLNINNATRWISIPIIDQRFQPSDFATFAVLVIMATLLSQADKKETFFKQPLFSIIGIAGIVIGLIALSNISSALLLFFVCGLLMIIRGMKLNTKYSFLLVGIIISLVSIAFLYGERGATAKQRFKSFFNEKEIPYQEEQAYIAIAGGEIFGKGPGQSHQKNLLPHPYSDFIFPIIIEEYGLIGGFGVMFLYLALLFRCIRVSEKVKHSFGKFLVLGLGFSLVIQAFTNMAVSVGLGPITGIPLPFLSMGGTSLLFSGLSLGVILSVSREGYKKK